MTSPSRLQARCLAVTLLGRVETRLRQGEYGPDTGAIVAELQGLEQQHGVTWLFDGLPALLDRYDSALAAWRELRP